MRDEEREQRVGWEAGEARRKEGEMERALTLPTEVAAAVFSPGRLTGGQRRKGGRGQTLLK